MQDNPTLSDIRPNPNEKLKTTKSQMIIMVILNTYLKEIEPFFKYFVLIKCGHLVMFGSRANVCWVRLIESSGRFFG